MPANHWSIWSLTPDGSRWMEVEEDLSEREATATAEQRTKVAHEHGIPEAQYIAMPKGQPPGPEHVRTLTAEERVAAQVGPERLARDLADAAEEDGYDGPILGVNTPPEPVWYADARQVLAFAHVLNDADRLDTIDHVLDYFEKPWDWDPEHAKWVEHGSPYPRPDPLTDAEGRAKWDTFVEALDS